MDAEQRLTILKADLQLTTAAHDDFLKTLLKAGEAFMQREGIKQESTIEYDMAVIHYAAYLFRKRAAADTVMPRFLRWELNNLLFGQKGATKE